ncbi:MAG: bacteriophage CI repressor [Spirochaetaceae bacterium]|nr:bacteriophage CI repressor [Spirochaetaceae bacterium]
MNEFGVSLDKEKTVEQMFKVCQYYDVKNVDLADLLGTTEVEVSNWRTYKRFPGWNKIMLFAYVFNLSLDDLIVRKKINGSNILDDIREKIKKIDQQNLEKTLERKTNNNENLTPECYRNVRWNPLVQDWVPLEKYDEIIEVALQNALANSLNESTS